MLPKVSDEFLIARASNKCETAIDIPSTGGGSSIEKVPGDVPPARVCFFKPCSLVKGILFANFSPFSLAKGILFANFRPFSLGKGILFGNFGQRNVKLR